MFAMNETMSRDPSLLGAVVEQSIHGIVFTDADGLIEYHNASAAAMFGASGAEVLGLPIERWIPSELGVPAEELEFPLPPNLVLAFAGTTLETRVRRRNGEQFVAEVTVTRLDREGRTVYALALLDVTPRLATEAERQKLQSQLGQARKLEAVGQLAAGVAHEINTPTQFIGDNLQFLRDASADLVRLLVAYRAAAKAEPEDVARARDAADRLAREVDLDFLLDELPRAVSQALEGTAQIAEIVAAMKAFCHPGRIEKARADLNAAIDNVISVSRNQWKYVATVVRDLDPDLPLVLCNENELRQVLLNLVINASHALESKQGDTQAGTPRTLGTIHVRTRRPPGADHIEIEVADDGPGIPAEVQPRLFDPFFTTKEVGKGTGQGLAVVHAIVVEHHGGSIEVRSEVGHGAAFVLRLPL